MKLIKSKNRKKLEIIAAQLITKKIHEYLKTQKHVILGIPGGRSIFGILELLKHQNIPWKKVQIFMVDERLVSLDDQNSNYKKANDLFIEYLVKQHKILKQNLHPYIYFNLPIEQGLNAYKNELREISHSFDIILLSSGEDGHVASLFPNHNSIRDQAEFFINVKNAPKLPKERISVSKKLLLKSRTAILLFFDESKKQAFKNFQDKNLSIQDCPAKLVNSIKNSYVFTELM